MSGDKNEKQTRKWKPIDLEMLEQRIAPCGGGGFIGGSGNGERSGPNPGNGAPGPGH